MADGWPSDKFAAACMVASQQASAPKQGYALVVTTGGMNPPHRGHIALLHQAIKRLEQEGFCVLGAWLSPSHDLYVQGKARSLNTIGLSAAFRHEIAARALVSDPIVSSASWELSVVGRWPDFPEVTEALLKHFSKAPELKGLPANSSTAFRVFYACGTDHAEKCGLYRGLRAEQGIGVVVVPRMGERASNENPTSGVFVADPAIGEVASFSSTKVREAFKNGDRAYLSQALSPETAEFLLRPSVSDYQRFAEDYALVGVQPAAEPLFPEAPAEPARQRDIYISLSSLLRQVDRHPVLPSKLTPDALFFFGSKRSWIFPEGAAELAESRKENPKYTNLKYQPLRDLILEKEARNEVFFLKPPGFVYNGSLFHGHPDAFANASAWLQKHNDPMTGQPYEPLKLDPKWWQNDFKRADAKYTSAVGTIVKNFQCGAHDYAPVQELLYQSNKMFNIHL